MNISDILNSEYTISQETVRLSAARPLLVQSVTVETEEIRPHDHEFYELALVRSGEAFHRTESGRRKLGVGDFLVLAPGQVHAFEAANGLSLFNIYYLAEWLLRDLGLYSESPRLCMLFGGANLFPGRIPNEPVHARLSESCARGVASELELLANLSKENQTHPVLARGAAMKCFAWWDQDVAGEAPVDFQFLGHPLVRHMFECIENNITNGQACDLKAWALSAGCSPDHLSRVFRAQTGENPVSCFQRRRLQHAAHELIYSGENMSEIAHRLGFSDSAHFSRQFQGRYGVSPKRYRSRFA